MNELPPSPENPVPIREYAFTSDYSYHTILSCKNHPDLRWSSKDPYARSIFYRGHKDDTSPGLLRPYEPECDCPMSDMTVVGDPKHPGHTAKEA